MTAIPSQTIDDLLRRGLAERARGDSGELLNLIIRAAETMPQRRGTAWNAPAVSRRLLMFTVAALLVAGLIGAIALGMRPPPSPLLPFVPHANGEIVAPGAGCSLVAVDSATGRVRPFFGGVPHCYNLSSYHLAWNPTGTLLAFDYWFFCGGCGSAEAKAAIAAKVTGLWVLDPATTHLRQLVQSPLDGASDALAWSPDGKQIAYVRKGGIWVVSAGDGQARQVSLGSTVNSHPTWSPDSRRLGWIEEGSGGVMVLDVSGETPTHLFDASGGRIVGIDWASDGRSLVVSSDIGGGTLRVVDPKGSASLAASLPEGAAIPYARLSPDRSRVAFEAVVTAPDSATVPTTLTTAEVWTMATDGSVRRRLFATGAPLYAISDLAWSPDGRFVIFSTIPADDTGASPGASYLAAEDGSGIRRVSDMSSSPYDGTVPVPAWQPLPVPTEP